MATLLDGAITAHAQRHGWPEYRTAYQRRAMRVLQAIQDTPGGILRANDVDQLRQLRLPVQSTIEIAMNAGVMIDDRPSTTRAWFDRTVDGLPAGICAELGQWYDVMLNGATTAPRRRPRDPETAQTYLRWALPALRSWADDGAQSLREITAEDVRRVLPDSGNPRSTMGAGLRCIFTILKERKLVFVNPIARIRTGGHERRTPLPTPIEKVREGLASADVAVAAASALAAFHALTTGEILNLRMTDIVDGRARVSGRTVSLAEPVRARIGLWLDERARRWPVTANPHLFVNRYTALRTSPMHRTWFRRHLPLNLKALREDRVLAESIATGGDVKQLCLLFGIDTQTALRYVIGPDPSDQPGGA
jgi:hypothetical protein